MAIDPTAILGADSSQYTPDVLQRRQLIAQKLYMDAAKTRPYRTWLEGVGDLANTGVYAAAMKQGNDLESGGQAAIAKLLAGGSPQGGALQPGAMGNGQGGAPAPITMTPSPPGREYAENELSPLDPVAPGVGSVPAKTQAFLNTMRGDESGGGGGRYDSTYGNRKITDFSDHPRIAFPITSGPNKGRTTTAAGADQFLAGTWDQAKNALNLPDFSPNSQDKGAAWLANRDFQAKTGVPLDDAISQAQGDPQKLQQIGRMLSGTWTSLPGGIEQGANAGSFGNRFSQALAPPGMPAPGAQTASLGPDMPQGQPNPSAMKASVDASGRIVPDQEPVIPGANNATIAAQLGQQGAIGAVPPPQPDRAAIAGQLNAQPPVPPQNVPQPPVQMAQAQGVPPQAQGLPPQGAPQGQPQGQQLPPQVVQMLQHPNPYVRQRGIDLASKLQEQQLAPPELKTLTNMMGEQVPYSWQGGKLTPLQGGNTGGQSSLGITSDMPPDEMLKAADAKYPGVANRVEQLYRGEGGMPNKRQNPLDGPALSLIQQVHPDWNMADWKSKSDTQTAFAKGPQAQAVTSFNRVMAHSDSLDHAIDKLGNFSIAPSYLNPITQHIKGETDPEFQKARADFNTYKLGVSTELEKAMKGAGVADVSGVQEWKKNFDMAKSPEELHAGVKAGLKMLEGAMGAMATQYNNGMKINPGDPRYKTATSFLSPPAKAGWDRLVNEQGSGEKPAEAQGQGAAPAITEGATATNPQTGQKLMFKNGQWGPAQ